MARLEVDIDANIKDLNRKLGQIDGNLNNTQKSFSKLQDFAIGALSGIAAAFSISAMTQFSRAILDTTAKFQKFEAVLTNTLGSSSSAQIAMQKIVDFASKTPFSVDELTSSFVKLANQGFQPTISELRNLGDLAASTGKSFDQLAEAIIDAQVGEFERLKEFGIRAKKEGDKVTFTFKGVETQVVNTDKSIRDYILSLGSAEGVSGAMAAISETLGGKLSNLGDNIEQLKLAIGDQTSGVFASSINWLNSFISLATAAAKSVDQIRAEASQSKIGAVLEDNKKQVLELAESYKKINPQISSQLALAKAIADVSRGFREAAEGGEAFVNQSYTFGELEQINEGFNQMAIELLSVSGSAKKTGEALGLIGSKTAEINVLNEQRDLAKDQKEVNLITAKVKALQDQLDLINAIANRASEPIKSEVGILAPRESPFAGGLPFKSNKESAAAVTKGAQTDPTAQMVEAMRAGRETLANVFADVNRQAQEFNEMITQTLTNGISNSIADLAFSIGEALATGGNVFKAIGSSLLDSIGAFLGQLGEQLIQVGVAGLAFATLLETIKAGGPAAIPAAIAAIAIGAAMTVAAGAFRSMAGRGLSGGGGGNVSSGGASQSFGGTGIGMENQNMFSNVTFTIEGTTLIGVLDRTQNRFSKG